MAGCTENSQEDSLAGCTENSQEDSLADREDQTDGDADPPQYRLLRSASIMASFLSLGLGSGILGPTLVSMEILLDTDTKTLSSLFTCHALGYLLGPIICAAVYSRLNKELMFYVCLLGICVLTAVVSFAHYIVLFVALLALQAACMGVIDSGGQSYMLSLWRGHRWKEPLMQALNCLWSLGSLAGAILIKPFLADITPDSQLNITSSPTNLTNNSIPQTCTNCSDNSTAGYDEALKERVSVVRFGYVVIAAVVFVTSILFLTVLLKMGVTFYDPVYLASRDKDSPTVKKKTKPNSQFRKFRKQFLAILSVIFFLEMWVEYVPGVFLAAFVVKGLGWPNESGSRITGVYWGLHAAGRLIGIPLAMFIVPQKVLIINLIVTLIGFSLMFFIPFYESIIWVGVSVAGLGMGSTFAAIFLWAENYIEVDGRASSIILAGGCVGAIVSPPITGYVFEEFGHMTLVYISFSSIVCHIIVFIAAFMFTHRATKKGLFLWKNRNIEIEVNGSEHAAEMKLLKASAGSVLDDGQNHDDGDLDLPNTNGVKVLGI